MGGRKRYAESIDDFYLNLESNESDFPFNIEDDDLAIKKAKLGKTSDQNSSESFISNASVISNSNEKEVEEFDLTILDFPIQAIDDKLESNDQSDRPKEVGNQPQAEQTESQSILNEMDPANLNYLISQGMSPESIATQMKTAPSIQPTYLPQLNLFANIPNTGSINLRDGTKINYKIKETLAKDKIVVMTGLPEILKITLLLFFNNRIKNYDIQGVSYYGEDKNTLCIDIDGNSNYLSQTAIENLITDLCQGRPLTQGNYPGYYKINSDSLLGNQVKIIEKDGNKEVLFTFNDKDVANQITKIIRNRFADVPQKFFKLSVNRFVYCSIKIEKESSIKDNEAILDMLYILLDPNASKQDFKKLKSILTYETTITANTFTNKPS